MNGSDRGDRRRVPVGWDEAVDLWKDPAVVPDPAQVEVPAELRTEIEARMASTRTGTRPRCPALAAAQKVHGWCSPLAILQVAAMMQVTPAYLSSVATFYDMLRTEPVGERYVYVCTSVACHVRNAKGVYDAIAEEARDQELEGVDVREFECLGACDMAPMASVDGRYVGPLDRGRRARAGGGRPRGPRGASREGGSWMPEMKVLTATIDEPGLHTIEVYERLGGYRSARKALFDMEPEDVVAELEGSGLRGRGGAGFSMGKKAAFIPKGAMNKYLCCNADESEPGTFKDRLLMQKNPHLLVEGCIIGSIAAGANRAFIFIRGEYEEQADILDAAVAEAYEKGYLGEGIFDSRTQVELVVHRGQGAYICGEESALLDALEGKRGNPRLKPPFPANQGLYQGPTLINNVETLCNAPLIIEKGADWFKGLGVGNSTGTKVVSVSGNVQKPGNYEIELGVTGREIVEDIAGGTARRDQREVLVPRRIVGAGAPRRAPRPSVHLRGHGRGRLDARLRRDHRRGLLEPADRSAGPAPGQVLPPRVLRQVRPLPGGHELDREDARADGRGRGHAHGHPDHGRGAGEHHRQLPVRAGGLDGDADPLDGQALPGGVRGAHGAGARRGRP